MHVVSRHEVREIGMRKMIIELCSFARREGYDYVIAVESEIEAPPSDPTEQFSTQSRTSHSAKQSQSSLTTT